jgi:endonuclease/exonuclease/phosphatase family metal-dependent hydrolase
MRHVIHLLSVTLLLAVAARAAEAPRTFTIATFNILYLNPDLPKTLAAIQEAKADFLALQETNAESERFLRARLGGDYPHMAFRGGQRSDGFGFMSKSPLRNLDFLEPLPGWRGAWFVEVELGGAPVRIASVHLATPQIRRADSLPGLVMVFQDVEALHAKEIRRIHERLSNASPAVVLGDFNSFSFFVAPRFLAERGFTDSFAAVHTEPDQHGTWRDRRKQGPELPARIDFLFHTKELRTTASRLLRNDASDHSLLVSTLEWVGR